MRQGPQQNRRGRGRSRKPQNPLARSFESNGPDVKIRGTAAHIAEKYTSLARDALSSGDLITAESYLQYAEHYNRIIMAAQAQLGPNGNQPNDGSNGGGFRPRWSDGSDYDDSDDDETGPQNTQAGGESRGENRSGENRKDSRGGENRSEGRQGDNRNDSRGGENRNEARGGENRNESRGGQNRNDGRGQGHDQGRDQPRRQASNGAPSRDGNGADQPEPQAADESAPDPVS